jgi:hypothetical protein
MATIEAVTLELEGQIEEQKAPPSCLRGWRYRLGDGPIRQPELSLQPVRADQLRPEPGAVLCHPS